MNYKYRLIVPTIVTLSLLGVSANIEAEEHNKEKPKNYDAHAVTYESSETEHNKNDTENKEFQSISFDENDSAKPNNNTHAKSNHPKIENEVNENPEPLSTEIKESSRDSAATNEDNVTTELTKNNPDRSDTLPTEKQQKTITSPKVESSNSLNNKSTNESSTPSQNKINNKSIDSENENSSPQINNHTQQGMKNDKTVESNNSHNHVLDKNSEEINTQNKNPSPTVENIDSSLVSKNNDKTVTKSGLTLQYDNNNNSNTKYSTNKKSEIKNKTTVETSNIDLSNEYNSNDDLKKSARKKFKKTSSATTKINEKKSHELTVFKSMSDDYKPKDSSFAARIKSSNNSGLYSPVTSSKGVDADFLLNNTVYIDQKVKRNGETLFRVNKEYGDRLQGWMKEKDLHLWEMFSEKSHKKTYSLSNQNGSLLEEPLGTKNQAVSSLKDYNTGQTFHAQKSLKIGAVTYYYGKLGNDYGWINDSKISSSNKPIINKASFAARIKSSNNSGLYSPVTSSKGVDADFLLNNTVYIDQKVKRNGETLFRVNKEYGDRLQGWMKEKDLYLWEMFGEKSHKKTYSLSNQSGSLLEVPLGTKNQAVSSLKDYNTGQTFHAQKSLKIGAVTYYYGKLGNDYGWLSDSKIKTNSPPYVAPSPSVKTVRHSQSLTQAVNTQMNLSSKPQAWANSGGWRNATRSEVARFLDTSHQTSETWMYTFLDLDRSQNIASSTINNKLLNGKGSLHNQGSAFINAANTQGINEVYLISHAIHETGNGQSTLAQGVRLDSNGNISSSGKKYYNMYGVGAYDYNPVLAGARYAQNMGWDTPAKAIIGGAKFISQSYFNRGQTTLYSMRWNPLNPGTYQYATDVNWAYATARNLQNYYQQLGIRGKYYTKHIF